MFTSRAEFRLTLRPDNADQRLTAKGYQAGCVSEKRYQQMLSTDQKLKDGIEFLKDIKHRVSRWRELLGLGPAKSHQQRKYVWHNTQIRCMFLTSGEK